MEMATSLEKLEALQASMKVRVASREVQDEVMAAMESVSDLQRRHCPKATAGTTPYISRLLATLQFFIRHSPAAPSASASSAQPVVEVVGKTALKQMMQQLKDEVAVDEKKLTLSRLDPFQSFKYLLDDVECKLLDSWVSSLLQKASSGQMAVSGRVKSDRKRKGGDAPSSGIERFF